MVEVSRSGAVRTMISWRNVQQSSDRIARTLINAPVCRTFLRSVSLWVIDSQRMVTDRSHKYRLRIDARK